GANDLLFLPYLMGERSPWYNLDLRASFLGATIQTVYGDFYRAIMEGVAMNLNILLNAIRREESVDNIVLIGGGGRSKAWQQILA
ncbi:FGGY-family carbohydrate kinase, partial [Acinetobacter baumannii]